MKKVLIIVFNLMLILNYINLEMCVSCSKIWVWWHTIYFGISIGVIYPFLFCIALIYKVLQLVFILKVLKIINWFIIVGASISLFYWINCLYILDFEFSPYYVQVFIHLLFLIIIYKSNTKK
jgi:hypothetical protein